MQRIRNVATTRLGNKNMNASQMSGIDHRLCFRTTPVGRCLSGAVLLLVMAMSGCTTAPPTDARKDAIRQQPGGGDVLAKETPMKTIGIIGGVSWVSSLEYYRLMNEMVRDKLGGLNSAKVLMYSIEFGEFSKEERLAARGNWAPLRKILLDAAQRLERGGADFIVIASNTLNSQAELIAAQVKIPVLHIADATGRKVKESGIKTVALLGTAYTMEARFYQDILEQKYGLKVVTPNASERDYINTVIFDELCAGKINAPARARFVSIIDRLAKEDGAQGAILGCTEIPLLIQQKDVGIPVFDTTAIHSEAAVNYALQRP